ncbi:hypothetical protein [Thalassotalea eurytherma]|uniref:Phosphatidate cytidylyltransferase n=1 Tax=Thalassotalea eurytherma TaxID=1144278 RepID=A0ABQ6H9J6_9GAMM|nr:hypothetical protein [Thalassotalea eurytherma]GLX83447.1 hypothetical protein theurythT_29000 [Thalassotalea eurytherma]
MKKLIRYLLILSLLVLAIVFYSLGSINNLLILLIIGFGLEVAFWLLAFKDHRKEKNKLTRS